MVAPSVVAVVAPSVAVVASSFVGVPSVAASWAAAACRHQIVVVGCAGCCCCAICSVAPVQRSAVAVGGAPLSVGAPLQRTLSRLHLA